MNNECTRCHGTGRSEKNIPGNEGTPEMDVEIICPVAMAPASKQTTRTTSNLLTPMVANILAIHCKGHDCDHDQDNDPTVSERHDAYGLSTGYYCDQCYEHNYPYRKDKYFDPSFAGERMDDDY